ncbi:heterokaryon incompatibility protein-domain-containing protein [Apiospora rasikravindrae]|uniref:Heterokaryon incompatibility protein-domain-containing protein n=1 Tax=Apiospora rasikravindrae TaxID=990691 RepID=A0ABR1SPI4_9PEZI
MAAKLTLRSPSLLLLKVNAIWTTKPVYFEDRAHSIVSWLRTCSTDKSDKHAECAAPAPPYPARFLDVNTSLDDRFIKLVRPEDVAPDPSTSRIRYLALSHCWGSTTTRPFITTKATLRDRMSGIWISVLPKTFQDAIRVARVLEVQYLWIDSLCIVQDDLQDWTVEAAKMADVYQGSYFTIAATSSPDGDGGLYLDSVTPATRVDLRRAKESSKTGTKTSHAETPDACYIRYPVASLDAIRNGPLSSRAWVLQEQMLSTRLIHFTDSQMFYQCAAGLSSEDGVLYNTATPFARQYEDWKWEIGAKWWVLVTEYSRRSITRESDRMAAMTGIVKAFSQKTGAQFALGLWRNLIWMDLGWYSFHSYDSRPTFDDPTLSR